MLAAAISGYKFLDENCDGIRNKDLIQGSSPDVVFVVDVSSSTAVGAGAIIVGQSIGDVNSDGVSNTNVDAELAGFIALNQQLIAQGLGDGYAPQPGNIGRSDNDAHRTLKLNASIVLENIVGGSGDDTYVFATATTAEADTVTEGTSAGTDTLSFSTLTTDVILSLGTSAVQTAHVNRTLKLNATSVFENIAGGSGNDTLTGNTLANILIGNAGGDTLNGSGGRDILIGGLGLDTLNGGDDEDIVIAGRTTSDALFSNLNRLLVEWASANSYATRISNLRAGVGSPAVSLKAKVNVLNDAGEDDSLVGGNGTDWYFRALDDVVTGLVTGEILDVL
jgi:Ca2+-binding RTX toxin-like protein